MSIYANHTRARTRSYPSRPGQRRSVGTWRAEVFAAEFIYPEAEFLQKTQELGIQLGKCSPEHVLRLKRECGACVSYLFLRKRLVRLRFAPAAVFERVQFQKLEEQIYGVPVYKQDWFKQRRALRRA